MTYIRSLIFSHIDQIFKVEYDEKRSDANRIDAKRYMGPKEEISFNYHLQ
ncbi:hypothetical protein DFA_04003 [Cavenderia fasciculata]|uniref:Uncharacterized protein n=1 Tax=Cavenderia fasciculata TaxID=261658 RepID=F4Q108_CACFS|nr:uncharacterized protein DFA_04003 [Cavenderia fasciculata]EGG18509.1 hypothetical protein DFA_04003 [Cavenderia fasciculata]|eukprot:XP_004366413.1 hypothetical protein DFA_04003 [Cavenderia fasciculata]